MSKDVLYYQAIEFRKDDYQWLWVAALLWDRVYRTAPKNYKFNEPRNVKELCSGGEIGVVINADNYTNAAARKFRKSIGQENWVAVELGFDPSDEKDTRTYMKLHHESFSQALIEELLQRNLGHSHGDYLEIPEKNRSPLFGLTRKRDRQQE
jgi:hypothetical protein